MNKDEFKSMIPLERIENVIYVIRGQKVMLDRDLAILYGTETRVLIQAVKRNIDRFPEDFIFQLTKEEWANLKCQIGTSSSACLKSQIVISNGRGGMRTMPYVFTEHGVAMASNLLKSKRAVVISVEIVRAFIRMRQMLTGQKEMGKELTELKSFLLKHANHNDREFKRVWDAIGKLSQPLDKEQRKIGFQLD